MPELPEVEVVKRSLKIKLKNLLIKRVLINNNKLRYKINNKMLHKIENLKIISVTRRSKYLLINLNKNYTILTHLGMTGKFFIIDSKNKKHKTSFYYSLKKNDSKHDHLTIYLSQGYKLIYNDVRKFGFIKIFPSEKVHQCSHLRLLGPEPLSKDYNINYFNKYKNKKLKVKNLLMNQKFIAGLGNIYCNEILFMCKINPNRIATELDKKEVLSLIKFTKIILKRSILKGGSSIKDFTSSDGQSGNFQQEFNVYNREKSECNTSGCFGVIKKTYTSNRSSFFCPRCQK